MFEHKDTFTTLNYGRSWANIRNLLIENNRNEGKGLAKHESIVRGSNLNQNISVEIKLREGFSEY